MMTREEALNKLKSQDTPEEAQRMGSAIENAAGVLRSVLNRLGEKGPVMGPALEALTKAEEEAYHAVLGPASTPKPE